MNEGDASRAALEQGRDVEESQDYRPFEDTETKGPRIMSFEQEGGKGNAPQIVLGFSPPESSPVNRTGYFNILTELRKKELVQFCYLSGAAVAGALLRIMLAQLFGEECKNPGTVGWLKASSPLCVTADGQTEFVEGGIVFADLPANLLGSFFMGLMQDGNTLGLAIPVPVAWLSPLSDFQSMTLIHFAIKTGFCGSLTTFSSWNSEMVVLMFGSGYNRKSQFVKAIFGYLIGMETALGSYVFGTTCAKWLHRLVNPELADEADAMRKRQQEGVFINRELPEAERRFLHNLTMPHDSVLDSRTSMPALRRWRESTQEARRVRHPSVDALSNIEQCAFCDHVDVPPELKSIARQEGWDLDALHEWTTRGRLSRLPRTSSAGYLLPYEHKQWYPVAIAVFLVGMIVVFLIAGVVKFHEEEDYLVTYRTMVYSLLFAPFGAFTRWQLSSLNGAWASSHVAPSLNWIPAGTLAANVLGSMVSIAMTGLEFRHPAQDFWVVGTFRAIRVGFAGCLTTVSTFVSEIHKFFHQHEHDRGYFYILMTLGTCCLLSTLIYAGILHA